MHIQESGEMYLEAIHVLTKRKGTVRSVEVSEYMGYSKPSISRAVGILSEGGYITVDPHGYIRLTETGRSIAEKIYERHTTLTSLLVSLGVDPKTASEDACKIEHDISDASFEALKKHVLAINRKLTDQK